MMDADTILIPSSEPWSSTKQGTQSMSNERPWLENYPAGVPEQIDVNQYASVPAVLEEAFARFRDRPAFASFGRQLSYGQIDEMSRQFAGYLTGVLKLGKGDRIAIMMPNVLQYPIALFGALRAGLVVVNTNPMYTARELEHQLEDCRRQGDRGAGQLRRHLAAGGGRDRGAARHHHRHRRPARLPQGRADQLRAEAREEDGAGVPVAAGRALPRRAGARRGASAATGDAGPRRHRLPAIHRRHHRRGQGRDADPRQHGGEHAAGRCLDRPERASMARKSSSPRCRCTTSSR